jgi:N utilization substance protein B
MAPAKTRALAAARLAAVQGLYQHEMTGASPARVIDEFMARRAAPSMGAADDPDMPAADIVKADADLYSDLVRGTAAKLEGLDALIGSVLVEGWTVPRLEAVLRAILRVAVFELGTRIDVPARVIISEYVEIAHAFFAGREPGLVNGLLDTLARRIRPQELEVAGGGPAQRR